MDQELEVRAIAMDTGNIKSPAKFVIRVVRKYSAYIKRKSEMLRKALREINAVFLILEMCVCLFGYCLMYSFYLLSHFAIKSFGARKSSLLKEGEWGDIDLLDENDNDLFYVGPPPLTSPRTRRRRG
jgi:hypothetical protein